MGITGLYNQTLTLQSFTKTSDGMGGNTKSWTDIGSFRGRISPLSTNERMMQDRNNILTTHRIFCANMTVNATNRIKWGDFYFEIVGIINPSEMYHHLEIEVKELGKP